MVALLSTSRHQRQDDNPVQALTAVIDRHQRAARKGPAQLDIGVVRQLSAQHERAFHSAQTTTTTTRAIAH